MQKKTTLLEVIYNPTTQNYIAHTKEEPSIEEMKNYVQNHVPAHLHHYLKDMLEEIANASRRDKEATLENLTRELCDGYVKFSQNAKKNNYSRHSCKEYYDRAKETIDLIEWIQDNSSYHTSFIDKRPKGFSI